MSAPADKTAALIAALWQKNKPIVEERIAVLESLPANATHQQREEAIAAAHKLSGSLGMYGFPAASEAAAKIEHTLKHEGCSNLAPLIKELRLRLQS